VLRTWIGIGPQIEGLGHLGENGLYFNCNDEKDFVAITGLKKLGTHQIPPLVGRGVIFDMAKRVGPTACGVVLPVFGRTCPAAGDACRRSPKQSHSSIWLNLDSQTKCDTGYIRDRHGNTVQPPHT
jgi:hypothetical protein